MANKRITDVDIITSLNGDESFFINQNNAIKQINKKDVVFGITNGGTGATTVAGARNALGLGNTDGALPIANGGTGATTIEDVKKNLNISIDSLGAQPQHIPVTINVPVSDWVDKTQSVFVGEVTSENTVIICPHPSYHKAYVENGVLCISQEDNKLVFSCEFVPESDIQVNIVILN